MPQIIIDPDEVRNFARFLEDTVDRIKNQQSLITAHFSNLKEVWQDHKYVKFERVFSDTNTHLNAFLILGENYSDYLRRKAEKADRYLDNSY